MDIATVIRNRRAYRSLSPITITQKLIDDLAESAQLAPSCFNKQPWRYIFVYDPTILEKIHTALSSGNDWAKDASLIVAVISKKDYDCLIGKREYYLFDVGLSTGFLILRATALGLVAHPIAGYSPRRVREILHIPDDMNVVTLLIIGEKSKVPTLSLTAKQLEVEKKRPLRNPFSSFIFHNTYTAMD